MSKKRVHEIAKEHGLSSKELLERLQAAGVAAKAAASSVEEADALRGARRQRRRSQRATATKPAPAPRQRRTELPRRLELGNACAERSASDQATPA